MNKIFLSGHLTADPEMRKTKTGIDVCNFSIGVTRPGTKRADNISDFFRCTMWGSKDGPGRAGTIQQYFHKGDGIIIEGIMTQSKFTDKDGKNRTDYDVLVRDFEFPMGRRQDAPEQPKPDPEQAKAEAEKALEEASEEPLPF